MRIDIHGRNYEVTRRFRNHVEPRIQTLQRHLDAIQSIKIVITQQRQWRVVEITVDADGILLRAEERSDDELTSFDRALDAINKQVERYKDRLRRYRRRAMSRETVPPTAAETEEEELWPEEEVRVMRVKSVPLKPMTVQEAAMQMELLGHDFFLFQDAETEKACVIYRRRDGDYGLLVPE
jgi:putative sigma-54 modulation protein